MATIYLDPAGNDNTGDGSTSTPYKTIARVLQDDPQPGDTIIAKDGTYTDSWRIEGLIGTSANHITIQAESTLGAEIVGNWTAYSRWFDNSFDTDPWDWPRKGSPRLPKSSDLPPGADIARGGFSGGKGLFELKDCAYVDVIGFEAHSHEHRGLFFNNSDNCTFQDCFVHHTYETAMKGKDSRNCQFIDSENKHSSLRGWFRQAGIVDNHPTCCSAESCENVEWHGCTVYWGGGEGIGVGMCSTGCKMYNCTIYDIRTATAYLNWSGNDTVIANCLIYTTNILSPSDEESRGTLTRDETGGDNKCTDKSTRTQSAHVYGNIVVGWGLGFWLTTKANVDGLKVHNNLFYCPDGLALYIMSVNTGASWANKRQRIRAEFYNNIFVGAVDVQSTDGWRNVKENGQWVSRGKAIFFKNNFFVNNSWVNAKTRRLIGDDNIFGSDPGLVAPDTAYTGGTIDPNNFKLTGSSPCIDAGTDLVEISDDFFGGVRDDGSPDIGPHEYNSVAAPDLNPSFTMSASSVTPGTSVTLTDTSTITAGAIDNWTWEYRLTGGAWQSIGTSQNETFAPSEAGQYTIRLTIEDTDTVSTATTTRLLSVSSGDSGGDPGTPPEYFGNIITDGDFPDTTNWSKSNLTMSAANNELKVTDVTSAAGAQVYQTGLSITSGDQFMIEFDARCVGKGRSMGIGVIDHITTSTDVILEQSFVVPAQSEMEHFVIGPVTAQATTANGRFRLRPYALASGSELYWSNVVMYPYVEVVAGFTVSDSTPAIGSTVTLTDTSTGATAWQWYYKRSHEPDTDFELFSQDKNPDWITPSNGGEFVIRLIASQGNVSDTTESTLTTSDRRDYYRRGIGLGVQGGLP